MIREVDNRIAAIELNGNHIIRDCKTMLIFLKEKLSVRHYAMIALVVVGIAVLGLFDA